MGVRWRMVSSSTENYEDTAQRFLASLVERGGLPAPPIHLTVDYDPYEPISGVEYRRLSSDGFQAKSPITCLQHGDFLAAIPDVEVPLFTDCDIVVQRPLSDEDRDLLGGLAPGHVWCSHNAGEGDSLFHEALRCKPLSLDHAKLFSHPLLPFPRHAMYMPIYNTGVTAMHRDTWTLLFEQYVRLWPTVNTLMRHYARQQWLLSYLFTMMQARVHIWPEAFHTHGCFNEVRPAPDRFFWQEVGAQEPHLFVRTPLGAQEIFLRHHWNPGDKTL